MYITSTITLIGINTRLATVRSGPDRGLICRPLKRPDCTVQPPQTAVRSGFNETGPFSPVFFSLENGDCKKDRTVWSGSLGPQSGPVPEIVGPDCTVRSSPRNSGTRLYSPVQDRTVSIYICIIHSCRILSVTVLLPSLTSDPTWLRSKSHFRGILGVIALLPKRYS